MTTPNITLRTVPALEGWRWIVRGAGLLKANPIHIHMAFFFYLGTFLLLSMIPFVGNVLAPMFLPALYLSVMATIAQAERTSTTQPSGLFEALASPFKQDTNGQRPVLKQLAMLGLVYALAMLVVLTLYSWVWGDALKAVFASATLPAQTTLPNVADAANAGSAGTSVPREQLGFGMLGLLLAYTPVSLAFWFTQQLVGWHGQSISKALFFSWLGCWRNKAAFTVYALAWVMIFVSTVFLLVTISSLLGIPSLLGTVLVPTAIFLAVWVFCSFYASYESLVQVLD